jgi:hypothetical protein
MSNCFFTKQICLALPVACRRTGPWHQYYCLWHMPCIHTYPQWSDHEGLVPSKILDHTAAPRSRDSSLLWSCLAPPCCTAPTSNWHHQKKHIAPSQRGEASQALSPHCYSSTSSRHHAGWACLRMQAQRQNSLALLLSPGSW